MTVFPYTQPASGLFTFQPTLDATPYTAVVRWSLWGKRNWLDLYDLNGTRIFSIPVTESPAGVILQAIAWANGTVTATTVTPHNYVVGATAQLVVSGCTPAGYNGTVLALITDETTFQYLLAVDPGQATVLGLASYNLSMTAGYFDSTLVFRNGQFEVSP